MHLKIFLQQMMRSTKRTVLYVLLLTAVTAFFIMSANLYRNSVANLKQVEENYSTIAIMELYANIDNRGNPVKSYSEKCVGYKSVSVPGYDFSDIIDSDEVLKWDLREKYGASISGTVAIQGQGNIMNGNDIIRFRLAGDEPVEWTIAWTSEDYEWDYLPLSVEILDNANNCYRYDGEFLIEKAMQRYGEIDGFKEQVQRLNRSEEYNKVILYPDVEYVICVDNRRGGWTETDQSGVFEYTGSNDFYDKQNRPELFPENLNYGGENYQISYGRLTEGRISTIGPDAGQPFPIQRWEDVQNTPELKQYFDEAWEAINLQNTVYNVILTNDFSGVTSYHLGAAHLKEGRLITKEEYKNGAKVCIISEQSAKYQNWNIGDKLDMSFFEFEAFPNRDGTEMNDQAIWHKNTEGFFDEGEFEIVGIYADTPNVGSSEISRTTLAMPWNIIYVPHNAVSNGMEDVEVPVHGSRLTIWLKNGSIDRFMGEVEEWKRSAGGDSIYTPIFSFYDQGYSQVQPGLESMYGTARLLILLSLVLLIVTCVLLAYFYAQSQKHSIGIFRYLGGSKHQALAAVLFCFLIIVVIGTGLGTIVGYSLTEAVSGHIMEGNQMRNEDAAAFQAFVLQANQTEQSLCTEPDPMLTAKVFVGVLVLPMLLAYLMIHSYIHREPRELLPKSKH